MADLLHLIATDEGDYGVSLTSPQIPGLAYGATNAATLLAGLGEVLSFAGAPDLPQMRHSARRFETQEGDEYTIRFARDAREGERLRVAWTLAASLQTDQRFKLLAEPQTPDGVVQFLCAVPEDRLGWIFDQLDPRGDAIVVASSISEDTVWSVPFAHGLDLRDATSLSKMGLTDDSSVRDLVRVTLPSDEVGGVHGDLKPVLV